MRAGGFAAGSAMLVPVELRHDARTAQSLARFRQQLNGTDAAVLAAADVVDRLPANHPLTAEMRGYVDAELVARGLSLAPLAGGAQ